MDRFEIWKMLRGDDGNRAFMEPSLEDRGHKPAASAFSDRREHKGRPEGSLEQALSQDLDRGRNLHQDGKRSRSESRIPHNDRGRDLEPHTTMVILAVDRGWSHNQGHRERLASKGSFLLDGSREQAQSRDLDHGRPESPRPDPDKNHDKETTLAAASGAVGGAAPRNADEPRERKMLADDRHRRHGPGHREGLARPRERPGEEGARHATRPELERDLVRCGSARDGVPDHALRRSEEQHHGRRLSDEHSCRRTIGVGITARATVRAGRESDQGRRE